MYVTLLVFVAKCMDAEIVAIGTELLLGVTVDTNSAYLAQQLATIGIAVRRVTLIRDDMAEIVGVLRSAMERCPLVICSGGLGPTGDDLTREAIAQATDNPLEFHQTLLDDIVARFAAFKRPMSESNKQQAFVPRGAHIIRNPRGTAPAFVAERGERYVAALPGVPQELHYLTEHALLPYLQQKLGLNDVLIVREIHLSGLTEAAAGERIADIMLGDNPIVGITAKRGQHTIRIAATGPSKEGAEALIAPLLDLINQRFVGHLLGATSLEQRVGELLQASGARLALLENDVRAPVYRVLAQRDGGTEALALMQIRPEIVPPPNDAEAMVRSLARQQLAPGITLSLVVLIEQSNANFRTVHLAVASAQTADDVYLARGVDFGLAQAHEFVATGALDMLRRQLEQHANDASNTQS